TRKYGDTAADVLAWAESSAARLTELDDTDDRIARLREGRDELRSRLSLAAAALTQARTTAAERLSSALTGELDLLAMPHAVLEVAVRQTPADDGLEVGGVRLRFGSSGVDEVEFLLSANTGAEPRPLAKGASGGELSRVMLALEVALAGTSPVPTFVFDEVDSGVGGKAAVEVGRRLAALAGSAQVLVVTHLPQVAAYADRHVLVEKASDGSVTTSGLTVLDAAGRERELSRMFAGMAESETALAHARELLESAGRASS
ncbi:MAG TPA: DNA repair protein RecN, partial [Nocardioides sp.]|nr:DNA repair protein RecN [Nocardioides sp.]